MMLKSDDDAKKNVQSSQKSITLRDDIKKNLIKKSPFEFFTPRMRPRPSHFRKNLQGRNLDGERIVVMETHDCFTSFFRFKETYGLCMLNYIKGSIYYGCKAMYIYVYIRKKHRNSEKNINYVSELKMYIRRNIM